ncbi:hypothetical protein SELMODRAFT_429726 [Selaginella moellendorffii]|uniref:Uncharacterized protein n=1 Tax=Selaginella moellendorffii TaxID=88036 RepID=D8T739_SELML|nr:hypothetical protein SELMODRAFT_429726 [Selaginella moellendorffii]
MDRLERTVDYMFPRSPVQDLQGDSDFVPGLPPFTGRDFSFHVQEVHPIDPDFCIRYSRNQIIQSDAGVFINSFHENRPDIPVLFTLERRKKRVDQAIDHQEHILRDERECIQNGLLVLKENGLLPLKGTSRIIDFVPGLPPIAGRDFTLQIQEVHPLDDFSIMYSRSQIIQTDAWVFMNSFHELKDLWSIGRLAFACHRVQICHNR